MKLGLVLDGYQHEMHLHKAKPTKENKGVLRRETSRRPVCMNITNPSCSALGRKPTTQQRKQSLTVDSTWNWIPPDIEFSKNASWARGETVKCQSRGAHPVGRDPLGGVEYQIPHISAIYIIFHNNSKLQLWSSSRNNFMVLAHHNRNWTKESQCWEGWEALI